MQQRTQSQLTATKNSDIEDLQILDPVLEPISSPDYGETPMGREQPTYQGEKGFIESV